ncbi:PilW family protein [Halomonas getboli]|uniref:PilW family protein n=1 Tax=Halomonas getboli TaxID=2935862 RepID=UPI001FFE4BD5|nr:prepilin-type N-terminal cleavage/methylation domain-containing protein [Halomonas getboli]MCK2185422.1 prepilin-type N-terminal cleavage/methylation domain-containing protein [Halomonas getboli]
MSKSPYSGGRFFNGGFSLVELLVALVIGLIIVLGAGTLFITGLQSFNRMDKLAQRQETLRYVVDVMSDDVRSAFNPTSQNAIATTNRAVDVVSDTALELEYFDNFTKRGREGVPYCGNSSGSNEVAPFVDSVDDVYKVRYEFDASTGELKVSYLCGWLEEDGTAPDPDLEYATGDPDVLSGPYTVATGIDNIIFSRPTLGSASEALATVGVELTLPPLSSDDTQQVFEFVVTNRIKALANINANLDG